MRDDLRQTSVPDRRDLRAAGAPAALLPGGEDRAGSASRHHPPRVLLRIPGRGGLLAGGLPGHLPRPRTVPPAHGPGRAGEGNLRAGRRRPVVGGPAGGTDAGRRPDRPDDRRPLRRRLPADGPEPRQPPLKDLLPSSLPAPSDPMSATPVA